MNIDSPLSRLIFLDRYSKKDQDRSNIPAGKELVVCLNPDAEHPQRELAHLLRQEDDRVVVELSSNDEHVDLHVDQVDVPIETWPESTTRMANFVATAEPENSDDLDEVRVSQLRRSDWARLFEHVLRNGFVPAGRVYAGAGVDEKLTAYNCYVIPPPKDSRGGILETLGRMIEIFSRGGGVGIPLMTLRPRYSLVRGVNGRSSGSVSWAEIYSFGTGLIEQGGSRRGALMLIQYDWHPDILDFITSKHQDICPHCEKGEKRLSNCNISVAVSDAFMQAVADDADWELKFPETDHAAYDTEWNGDIKAWLAKGYPVRIYKTLKARELWDQIEKSAWSSAEPGLFFVDRYNAMSNSNYYPQGQIWCTNPCGEQGLPSFFNGDDWGGAVCNLGHLYLPDYIIGDGLHEAATINWAKLKADIPVAIRFMDDLIDVAYTPFEKVTEFQKNERRIGFGTMGLGEMLIRCHVRYGKNEKCMAFLDELYQFICVTAYETSCDLAREKGAFPWYGPELLRSSGFAQQLPEALRKRIAQDGLRNVTLLTQAPTGTTGTMFNTSTGIEPFPWWGWERKGQLGAHMEYAKVLAEYLEAHPEIVELRKDLSASEKARQSLHLPDWFVVGTEMDPEDHAHVQAAIQRWVDSSISKTSNLPADYTQEEVGKYYKLMYELGCKGGTVYRDGCRDEQVLNVPSDEPSSELADGKQPEFVSLPTDVYNFVGMGIQTAMGKVHVKLGIHPIDNKPFEMWLSLSKGGTALNASKEALARLASLVMRINSPVPPLRRIQLIADQLEGIRGGDSFGFGPHKVLSFPDAIAKALKKLLVKFGEDGAPVEVPAMVSPPAKSKQGQDICPSCGNATLYLADACMKCAACPYSVC